MDKAGKNPSFEKNKESGMSLVESLPLILVMASLVGFLLGLWGMTHKNILHSIAARNYAFETFRHRSNLMYFGTSAPDNSYEVSEMRFHAVGDGSGGTMKALTTPMRFPERNVAGESAQIHRQRIWQDSNIPLVGEASVATKLPWVMVGYGICLNSNCGDQ